jgi:signal transduction histidine kinase
MLLARADSGKEKLDAITVDAGAVVRSAAEQGHKLARTHGLQFSTSIPEGAVSIHADPDALRRALLILLDNAAKYTPEGGSVYLGLSTNNGVATMSVSDTGIGISTEDLPNIFDRFWRADKARSREQGGAGLGLSIAKWIADMHGGTIDVESQAGKGSTFQLKLPIGRDSAVL